MCSSYRFFTPSSILNSCPCGCFVDTEVFISWNPMDDGGEAAELSEHEFGTNSLHTSGESVDSFLDEFLTSAQTCTHTHTCNPPAPDAAAPHTHTCYHTHTQIIPPSKPKRRTTTTTTGNREAVRKYREKKKAHTAYLEEEVKKLRLVNQQLIRKVQRQAVLETEISRLRGLFLDLRQKIDAELGVSPFQKHCNSTTNLKGGNCGIPCSSGTGTGTGTVMMEMRCQDDELLCFHHPYTSSVERKCIPAIVACPVNPEFERKAGGETCGIESMETMVSSASQAQ